MIKNSIDLINYNLKDIVNRIAEKINKQDFRIDDKFSMNDDGFTLKLIERTMHDAPDTIEIIIPFWAYDKFTIKFSEKGRDFMIDKWLIKEGWSYTFENRSKKLMICDICESPQSVMIKDLNKWECKICGELHEN